jgi:hypothetical protein
MIQNDPDLFQFSNTNEKVEKSALGRVEMPLPLSGPAVLCVSPGESLSLRIRGNPANPWPWYSDHSHYHSIDPASPAAPPLLACPLAWRA